MEILAPISLGELYDKISILEIKQKFIKDEEKLKNILKELNVLKNSSKHYSIDNDLYERLKNINFEIWYTEDKIREKHRKNEFDFDFITYATRIYERNDERAEIKKQINLKYGSDIIEEKSYEKYE